MVSNVLLGGLAGYYLQTTFITFDEAEEIEGEWRLIHNRLFDSDFSTPRAEVYGPNFEGGQHRRHLWSMGVAALWSCMERAMAGISIEQHAAIVTSAVAMSLDRWGCCSDPGIWDFSHLEPLLRAAATKGRTRYLGDCWMLCTIVLERQSDARAKSGGSVVHRADVLAERRAAAGRWIRHGGESMLRAESPVWEAGDSVRLFEPVAKGGVGVAASRMLLEAGVKVAAHVCRCDLGGGGGCFIGSFAEAQQLNFRLKAGAEAQWVRVLTAVEAAGVAPVPGVRVRAVGCNLSRVNMVSVEPEPVRVRARLLAQLKQARAAGEEAQEGTQVWLDRFLATLEVGDLQPAPRATGAWDAAADAAGAHVV
eukprot:6775018-Prymnesium_polylepis.1